MRLEVRGVPVATYTLEASTNLRSWVPIHTATGAPFVFTAEMADPIARFYRVSVSSGRVSDK